MKTIQSAIFWFVGGVFFLILLIVMGLGLIIFGRDRTFPVVRYLLRIQTMLMGMPVFISGQHHIPHERPVIFMGNHESLFDVFVIPAAITRPFVGVEAAEQFSWPIWGWVIRKWGNIPIPRKNLKAAMASLDEARNRIEAGICIGILPEGTRTMTGEIGEFKKGPFHLALAAGADIVPFAMDGPFRYKSKHSWHLNPTIVRVKFGAVIPFGSFAEGSMEAIRDRVRMEIVKLKTEITK